jgi:hypothetical protein
VLPLAIMLERQRLEEFERLLLDHLFAINGFLGTSPTRLNRIASGKVQI